MSMFNHDRAGAHRLYFKNGFENLRLPFPLRSEIIFVERRNPMLKILTAAVLALNLAACASGSGQGSSQMYGEIKAGVETSHQR